MTKFFDRKPMHHRVRERVRDEFDGQVFVRGGRGERLHACKADEPICNTFGDEPKGYVKSLDVYPPGHSEWCSRCLAQLFPNLANIEVGDI